MANQTVSVNRNLDDAAIAGLANGEDITVNTGAVLTINSDNRWSQQAAVIGAISIDAGTGGQVLVDGRDVWWIPYDAGTGNVPALGVVGIPNCTGTGGATGEFLGIFTALGVAPTAAGAAMPATGFLKLRSKSGNFSDNEVITLPGGPPPATVTVNSTTGGQRGWIHLVGETATAITVPRLGRFEIQGDWFELGLTNGADNQTFQYPVADYCSAIQIETAPGSNVYEWWPASGTTRWGQNNRVAQDVRGKVCNSTAAGVIQIALRGAVNNGFKPASGCKVRIPNVIISTSASANWTLNNLYASTSSWNFNTSGSGVVVLNKVSSNMFNLFAQPYSIQAFDSSFQSILNVSECATAVEIRRCAVGIPTTQDTQPITMTSCFAGGIIEDCVTIKYELENNDFGDYLVDCDSFEITRHKAMAFGDNTAATLNRGGSTAFCMRLLRVTNSTLTDTTLIGSGIDIQGCVNIVMSGINYADCLENRTTNSTNPVYAVLLQATTANCRVEGPFVNFENLVNVHPYNGIINFLQAYNCELRNVGSAASPYSCGSASQMRLIANYGGNDADNIVRRCYVTGTGTGVIGTLNSSTRGQAINVWGDDADTSAIANLNFIFKGGRMAGSVTGQTAVYGTHWADHFSSTTVGQIRLFGNEPTEFSASQCEITSGTPKFTSTGQVRLTTIGDQVTWTMPYFALGHTALTTMTFTGGNQSNHLLEFQYDLGSGYSAWQTITSGNLAGVGAITPATGIKLKIRATCTTANTGNQITAITINTTTDSVSREIQYPLPGIQLTLTGLVVGSEVRAYQGTDPATAVEIDGTDASGTSFVIDYTTAAGQEGFIVVFALGYQPIRIPITYPADDSEIPIQQVIDRVYLNP